MKTYSYTTVHKAVLGDLYTPVGTYLRVRDMFPQSALMESSDCHNTEDNRSFIGLKPMAHFSISHGMAMSAFPDGNMETHVLTEHYRAGQALEDFLARFRISGECARYCGLYGYTAFDAVKYFEPVPVKDSREFKNDAPDMLYILYRYLIVFNDYKSEMLLVEMCEEDGQSHLEDVEKAIHNGNCPTYAFRPVGPITSTLTDEQHKENIRCGIAHCLRGDVFQVVLSRRFVQRYTGDDFKLYRALRSINPSPYLFYFDFGGFRIFGSSPETHCKIEGRYATIDPIAGTTRRSGDRETDRRLIESLLADPKENAEHTMLVDLARNDLSRNCSHVHVEFYKEPQLYSHVIHLVSRVSGELTSGASSVQTFIDTFPAGTLSGAPKVRAMQLIAEIEPHNRGAYGGCIGFIGFDGTLNQAITIRSFVSRNHELWFQAGGGIVTRSNEECELQEVNNKLDALQKAIALAEHL